MTAAPDDPAAWAVHLHPFVLRYSRGVIRGNYHGGLSAEDIAQQTCQAILTGAPVFACEDDARAWAATIAKRRVIDAQRQMIRNPVQPAPSLPEAPNPDLDPETLHLQTELAREVAGLLAPLSPQQRAVLWLRFGLEYPVRETAGILGTTEGYVRVSQYRALARLREYHGVERRKVPGKRLIGVAVCGTEAGYARHRNMGEPICGWCQAAYRAVAAERQRERRAS